MKNVTAHLELSTNFDNRTRERCPSLVFEEDGAAITAIRTDVERPALPYDPDSVDEIIILDDALSRVIDEETWLAELNRVLCPGGMLCFTLPAAGIFAWLDAMNAYRYIADISKRGDQPNAALPTGWNRHYRDREVRDFATEAGFHEITVRTGNNAFKEAGMLLGMIWQNWILRDREAELKLFPRFGRRDPREPNGVLTTTWYVQARKREQE